MDILIVDDDREMADCLARHLEKAGLEPQICVKAFMALDREWLRQFDAIVTDYRMPGMNGIEFAKRARELTAVPIILYTGTPEELESDDLSAIVQKGRFDEVVEVIRKYTGTGGQSDNDGRHLDMHSRGGSGDPKTGTFDGGGR